MQATGHWTIRGLLRLIRITISGWNSPALVRLPSIDQGSPKHLTEAIYVAVSALEFVKTAKDNDTDAVTPSAPDGTI